MIELTEDAIKKFEEADSDFEAALGLWHSIYRKLKTEQVKLHEDFRALHGLSGSNLHSIADWRWKHKA